MQLPQLNQLRLCLTISLLVLSSPLLAASSSTTLGSTDAVRCFEESRLVLGDQGIAFCDRAIERGDLTRRDLGATYSNRGIVHANNGRFRLALEDHNKAIALLPALGQAYINRGNAYYQTRDFELAIADYEKALSLDADPRHVAYYNLALTLLKVKRVSEARIALEQALALTPDSGKIKRQLELLDEP